MYLGLMNTLETEYCILNSKFNIVSLGYCQEIFWTEHMASCVRIQYLALFALPMLSF
jgi:hypothetical protein